MVTGGVGGQAGDTTELLEEGAEQWRMSGPLPSPRSGLKAATINKRVIVMGEQNTHLKEFHFNIIDVFMKGQVDVSKEISSFLEGVKIIVSTRGIKKFVAQNTQYFTAA